MNCIICDNSEKLNSIEHVVPESLGNKMYILNTVKICDTCNNRFSKFEEKAMSKTILGYERARMGILTKKDKPSKGLINGIEWTADINREKNLITAKGFNQDFIKLKGENTYEIRVPMYDKDTNVATSKLLLKIGLESSLNDLPDIAKKYDFTKAKAFLKGDNYNWPYAIPKTYASSRFKDYLIKEIELHLDSFDCRLSYRELNGYFLFRFKYVSFTSIICLNSDDKDWIGDLKKENKSKFTICPEYFKELNNNK